MAKMNTMTRAQTSMVTMTKVKDRHRMDLEICRGMKEAVAGLTMAIQSHLSLRTRSSSDELHMGGPVSLSGGVLCMRHIMNV